MSEPSVFLAVTNLLAQGLAGLFALAALLHLAVPEFLRAGYHRWGYSRSFVRFLGVLLALTALFLAVPLLRIWGGVLGGIILFAVTTALLNRERYCHAVPYILLLAALAPAMV